MKPQSITDYARIASAIEYIRENVTAQPDLDQVAEHVHLSPFHFQRMFSEWAGVSPKKFLQYLTIGHAKDLLQQQATLSDAAFAAGLSGTSRLHDLFIHVEGMTPGEYKNGGESLQINYSFAETRFGDVVVASTPRGVCYLAFLEERDQAFAELKSKFPNAAYTQKLDLIQQNALAIFNLDWDQLTEVKLHLKGTAFQLKVWEALLKIPIGSLDTYSGICEKIGHSKASRAVGSAVGDNPVAFLIPCHRVIRSTGEIGQYHWGSIRKTAIIGWESAKMLV